MAGRSRGNPTKQERENESQHRYGRTHRHQYTSEGQPQYSEASTPSGYYYRHPREHPLEIRTNPPPETPPGRPYSCNCNSCSPSSTHDHGYSEHTTSHISPPISEYIAPILPEHRESILRARRSLEKLAKGNEEKRKRGEVGRGEGGAFNSGARPYIAPILPEHRAGILKARISVERLTVQENQTRGMEGRQAEKGRRDGVHRTERRISPSQRGEARYEHPREQYPTVNTQDTYNGSRGHRRGRERQRESGNYSNFPQTETPVYAHCRPNREPTDDEFDYIYEPEDRKLTENPNPTRK